MKARRRAGASKALFLLMASASVVVSTAQPASAVGAGTTTRVSVDKAGLQGNADSFGPTSVSADGTRVAFHSLATNLVSHDNNEGEDVFVRDLVAGTTTLVSVDTAGGQSGGYDPSMSGDGTKVAFVSDFGLVPGDTNRELDVFVRDLVAGTTTLVSVDGAGNQANDRNSQPSISADGTSVAFQSDASNLVPDDINEELDVFVRDLAAGTTTLASVSTGGAQGDDFSGEPAINADGTVVAFESGAINLVPDDTKLNSDIFVRDLTAGTTSRVSISSTGAQANRHSSGPSISADGSLVAFDTEASTLVPGDTNEGLDVFVRDVMAGTTTRVSVDSAGNQIDNSSGASSISADGTSVAFQTYATLVPDDTNGRLDVFVRDLVAGAITRVSVDTTGAQADSNSSRPSINADGTAVSFLSNATNLVPDDTNKAIDVFLHQLSAPPPEGGFSVDDASAKEGSRRSGVMRFTVTLPAARASETTVRFRTADDTAVATEDYLSRRGTLRFAPGQTSKTVEIEVQDDDLAEADETLLLKLFKSEGAPIDRAVGVGTILEND